MRIASEHKSCGTFALGGHEKCRVNRIVFVPVTLREEISERIYLLYRVNSVHIHQKSRWNVVDFCGRNPHESVDGKRFLRKFMSSCTGTQSTRKCGWEAKSLIQLKICMVSTQSMRKRGWEVDGKLKPETPNCEAIHA